jgi:hypothetical protein
MDNQQEMTPLEAVTHLFTCLILSDGRMDFEEREAWADALTELFPDHSAGRAVDFMQDASRTILMMDSFSRRNYAIRLCSNIKDHFSEENLQNKFGPKVASLVEADGMVFSSEKEMVEDIEKELGISIRLKD